MMAEIRVKWTSMDEDRRHGIAVVLKISISLFTNGFAEVHWRFVLKIEREHWRFVIEN